MNTENEKLMSDEDAERYAEQMTEIVNEVVKKIKPIMVEHAEKIDVTSGRIGVMTLASTILYADMLEATIRMTEAGHSNEAPAQFVCEQFAQYITERIAKLMYMANIPDTQSKH